MNNTHIHKSSFICLGKAKIHSSTYSAVRACITAQKSFISSPAFLLINLQMRFPPCIGPVPQIIDETEQMVVKEKWEEGRRS